MARIVNYSTECPGCKLEGVTRFLGFDPEIGISCEAEKPHLYPTLPGEPEAAKSPELETETQQGEAPVPAVDDRAISQQQNRFSELMQERKEPPSEDLDAVVREQEIAVATAASEVIDSSAKERPRDFSSQIADDEPIPVPMGGATFPREFGSGYVGEGQVRELDGGDVLVGVRISEQWKTAISAEAEVRGQTFGEYFQEFINEVALMNEWSSKMPVDAT